MPCASPWNSRARTYSAAGLENGSSPFWPRGGAEQGRMPCGRWWTLGPVAFVGMILGFIFFWPIGLAILFYNLWSRKGQAMPIFQMMERAFDRSPFSPTGTGNMAFDDWRRAELERIERERQKLMEAEREFAAFSDELRRARDREEFERFMQARRNDSAATEGQA
jgi:hypothetical protein